MHTLSTAWLLIRRTAKEFGADNCSHMAAAISYYVLFSIVPLVVFLASIFGLVVRNDELQRDVADNITEFLNIEQGDVAIVPADNLRQQLSPERFQVVSAEIAASSQAELQAIARQLDAGAPVDVAGESLARDDLTINHENLVIETIRNIHQVSGALTFVGLAGIAWSASAMFGAIRKSLNAAWDVESGRPIVQQKLLDLGMVLGLGVLLGLSIAVTAAFRILRQMSDDALGPLSTGTGFFWSVLPLMLPAAITFVVFALLFTLVPDASTRLRDIWPGAALATVLFELLKNGFALYVAKFNNYDVVYGSLGAVLLFMLWTYMAANVLLVGAELAAEYPRVRRGDYANAAQERIASEQSWRARALLGVRGLFLRHPDGTTSDARTGAGLPDKSGERKGNVR